MRLAYTINHDKKRSKNKNEEVGRVLEKINNKDIANRELESIKIALLRESDGSWPFLRQKGMCITILAGRNYRDVYLLNNCWRFIYAWKNTRDIIVDIHYNIHHIILCMSCWHVGSF